jgi:hypothetical protein
MTVEKSPSHNGVLRCWSCELKRTAAALSNTVGVVAKSYSHEWSKVRQGRTDAAIKAAW